MSGFADRLAFVLVGVRFREFVNNIKRDARNVLEV